MEKQNLHREEPKAGELWRHYKGKEVLIWGIDFIFLRSRAGKTIYFGTKEKAIAAHNIPHESTIVIYQQDQKYWARQLENFLEVLPNSKNKADDVATRRYDRID